MDTGDLHTNSNLSRHPGPPTVYINVARLFLHLLTVQPLCLLPLVSFFVAETKYMTLKVKRRLIVVEFQSVFGWLQGRTVAPPPIQIWF